MSRRFVEVELGQVRRVDVLVALRALDAEDIFLQQPPHRRALGQPERQPRADLLAVHEELKLAAQPAVVAPLRLLQPLQVRVQFLLRVPRRAVDALEHRALLVATPVRPRDAHQLERPDLARVLDMLPAAEVEERPLLLDADRLAGQILDELDLVGLIVLAEISERLLARPLAVDEGMLRRDAGAHALLDGGQVLRRQRTRQLHIVVEAVLDRRADGEARAGKEVLHGLGQHVRRAVAHALQSACSSLPVQAAPQSPSYPLPFHGFHGATRMQGTGPAAFRSHSASDSACSRRASNARTCSIATSSRLSSSQKPLRLRGALPSIASIASISAARACGRAISSCRISLNPLFVKSHPIQRHHSQSRGGAAGGEPADRDIFLRIGERTPHTNTTFTTWSARRARNKKPFRPPGTKGRPPFVVPPTFRARER